MPSSVAASRSNTRNSSDIPKGKRRNPGLPATDASDWRRSPIIVGGTGGSGTRGVVQLLMHMGIYMHPPVESPIFKRCYNGVGALDNVCMHPAGVLEGMGRDDGEDPSPAYLRWLQLGSPPPSSPPPSTQSRGGGGVVELALKTTTTMTTTTGFPPVTTDTAGAGAARAGAGAAAGAGAGAGACAHTSSSRAYPLAHSEKALAYLGSVPVENRQALRWGWKNPKTVFHLQKLWSVFPGLVFLHALRNPLDVASVPFEHLRNRVTEFSSLLGGFEGASKVLTRRCTGMVRLSHFTPSQAGGNKGGKQQGQQGQQGQGRGGKVDCEITTAVLKAVSQCIGKDEDSLKKCARQAGYPNPAKHPKGVEASSRDDGWSCLAMQLWAEINTAVAAFGNRCLLPPAPPLTLPQQEQEQQQQHTGDHAAATAAKRPLLDMLQLRANKPKKTKNSFSSATTAQRFSSLPPPPPPPPPPRYVAWHSEDVFALRGPSAQQALQRRVGEALGLPLLTVAAAFDNAKLLGGGGDDDEDKNKRLAADNDGGAATATNIATDKSTKKSESKLIDPALLAAMAGGAGQGSDNGAPPPPPLAEPQAGGTGTGTAGTSGTAAATGSRILTAHTMSTAPAAATASGSFTPARQHQGEVAAASWFFQQRRQRATPVLDLQSQQLTTPHKRSRRRKRHRRGRSRRRLAYGKYLSLGPGFNVSKALACAEAAVPGALAALQYPPELIALVPSGGGGGGLYALTSSQSSGGGSVSGEHDQRPSIALLYDLSSSSSPSSPSSSSSSSSSSWRPPLISASAPSSSASSPGTWEGDTLGSLLVAFLAMALVGWKRSRSTQRESGDSNALPRPLG